MLSLPSVIIYIAPKWRHIKSRKDIRLIAWWFKDRLIIKDMDAAGFNGLHFFPSGPKIGGAADRCPLIRHMTPLADRQGWTVKGERAEGGEFEFEIRHDFVKNEAVLSGKPYAKAS